MIVVRHYNIIVRGCVQGVFYRASTQQKAIELGLSGWVRNENDGSVYMEVEGEEVQLKSLVTWCKDGPRMAQVDDVSYTVGDLENLAGFHITR